MYVCIHMYICHTLISVGSLVACVGSLVACVHKYDMHMVVLTLTNAMLREWTLMEPEQSLCDHARTCKQKQRRLCHKRKEGNEKEVMHTVRV